MVANAGDKKVSSLPFPAIVGQQELKRVLLAVAVNDELDGALVAGEKGTAKSTAVRALIDLLPEQRVVADCPYGCSPDDPTQQCEDCRERSSRNHGELPVETRPVPLVTLPLGATRDRVVGTLSVEDALAGEADFDPGLLARSHRGILYVDEVNLLGDHLVDVILDAAASGVNTVERDGMSVSHPAEFTLVGTMNPEEGDLRPQLRDRFALQATVEGCREIEDRVEVIDRSLGLERDDPGTEYADDVRKLRSDLEDARERLESVDLPDDFKADIARLCLEAGVDGHRGDVATARTARTLAALEGRTTVIEPDVHEAASYTLPHRLRSTPFEETPDLEDLLEEEFDDSSDAGDRERDDDHDSDDVDEANGGPEGNETTSDDESGHDEGDARDGQDSPGDTDSSGEDERTSESTPELTAADDSTDSEKSKERSSTRTGQQADAGSEAGEDGSGDDSRGETDESGDDGTDDETATPLLPGQRADIGEAAAPSIDVDLSDHETPDNASGGSRAKTTPTTDGRGARVRTEQLSTNGESGSIDAAASVRSAANRGESSVDKRDLRQSVRSGDAAVTIVFAVDASASMRPAMRTAKGVVLDLLRDSYQNRDEVAFVAFAGDNADVLLPPTNSITLAARHLKDLPSGDRTPLPAGLETTRAVLDRTESDASVVVLVTDGGANVAGENGSPTDATRQAARRLESTGASVVVVDAGDDSRAGLSELVAAETGGELVSLSALSVEAVRSAVEGTSTTD
ncbi:VWA domain-containing protein [Halostagnicola sp. A-GB9-2]|uniref:VWA domain-containing protein n=1 Tax=Halostagnicola sp. A-GB9-2 TaxID=3048066 RepID=UPI0024C080BE|nr:VWA domain-containing protein [Halostagnicola sp. A-GB9-2]MDJ1430588.1 VWA domain-containing protein [Halostagnicola sp. A-GB9-2]